MPVRTRDWLKFGTLVAIAFVFGLAFASTLNLPKQSGAAETLVVPSPQAAPQYSAPALKAAGDVHDAFDAVAGHVTLLDLRPPPQVREEVLEPRPQPLAVPPPDGPRADEHDPRLHVLRHGDERVLK